MALHLVSDAERRSACKAAIESLEAWLRRTIDMVLREHHGEAYIEARNPKNDDYIFGKKVRETLQRRATSDPARFPRPIDAATLEEEIHLVCHHHHYKSDFRPFFDHMFPLGVGQLRTCLKRLVAPRNALYHANWVSVRQAEQVICYSNDVIESIKHRFQELNMARDFNVPTIHRFIDIDRGQFEEAQFRGEIFGTGMLSFTDDPDQSLTVGERISLEVVVDPSFSPTDYSIEWEHRGARWHPDRQRGRRFTLMLQNVHVGESFCVTCTVTSDQEWHRHGSYDDEIKVCYRVLPSELDSSLSALQVKQDEAPSEPDRSLLRRVFNRRTIPK